jgi:glucose-6-phosphate 1-dehydrogenase
MALSFVIFGASGDLTSRKLIPALFQLFRKGRLPAGTQIIGFSRSPFTDQQWQTALGESTEKFNKGDFDRAAWDRFVPAIHYQAGDISKPEAFEGLHHRVPDREGTPGATRGY